MSDAHLEVRAIFKEGILVPLQPLKLNELEQVDLVVVRTETAIATDRPNRLVGLLADAPELADAIVENRR